MSTRNANRYIYLALRRYSQHFSTPAPTSTPLISRPISKPPTHTRCVTSSNTPSIKPTPSRQKQIIHSSLPGTFAILLAAATITIVLYRELTGPQNEAPPHKLDPIRELAALEREEAEAIMAGAPLPGRPDNLTDEQEKKLQEFWLALQQVCGVPELSTQNGNGVTVAKETQAESIALEKKKKRRGLFSRSKEDESAVSVMDGEDKYGQAKDYHKVLATQTPEQLRETVWSMVKHDNPDALLLRFLRARKWHVQNALIMLIATMHWRQEIHVDDDIQHRGELGALEDSQSTAMATKKQGEDFLMQMRLGKSFVHGMDKEGRPMCFVRVKLHHGADQSVESIERYTVFTIETSRLLLKYPVDTAAIVFDMTDFSLANMDYTPVKFMIKVFEANYPESLGVVLVHKSPWIFQSIWKIIKGWLDPVVASKIHFTKNLEELEQYIERKNVPKELGGDDPWEYKYVEPLPAENALMKDEATKKRLLEQRAKVVREYEIATQKWVHDPKEAGIEHRRAELAHQMHEGYWELDPYLRARSFYDRTGLIKKGGLIDYYPAELYGEKKAQQTEDVFVDAPEAPTANGGPIPAGQHTADDLD